MFLRWVSVRHDVDAKSFKVIELFLCDTQRSVPVVGCESAHKGSNRWKTD